MCRDLGLKPELDTIFRRHSGQRQSYIISPKPARCKGCSCTCAECQKCECKKHYDQRLQWLGKNPISNPGRKGTTLYVREEDTYPVILKGDYQVLYEKYMESL